MFVDPDGETLTFAATGLPAGLAIDPATGLISGTLPADASQGGPNGDGIYPVTVTVTDPDGQTTQVTFTFTAGNLPPVAVDDAATTGENAAVGGNVLTNTATETSATVIESTPIYTATTAAIVAVRDL